MITTRPLYTQIQELYLKCFRESSPHFISYHNAVKYILQLLAQFEILVEYKNDVVVGCIIYQKYYNILLDQQECFIHEWFISPEHRKKLVGMRLYKRMCEKAKELGCARLKGFSYNSDMIRTIEKHKAASITVKLFEKELINGRNV